MPEVQHWDEPPTVLVVGSTRRPRMWVAVAVALLAVAILKPWGPDKAGRETAAPRAGPGITTPTQGPTPTADRSAKGLAEPICLGSVHWLLASVERWRDKPAPGAVGPEPLFGLVRVWRALAPVAMASGPTDPGIPYVRVSAFAVLTLGWCAPVVGNPESIQPATMTAWLIVQGVARPIDLVQVEPAVGSTPYAAMYGPPIRCAGPCPTLDDRLGPGSISWAAGRYVFRYENPGVLGEVWFAVDLDLAWQVAEPTAPASPGLH